MKIPAILCALLLATACHNTGNKTKSEDTTMINTNTGNLPEGGPNHGLGDTNSYNRMNDTVIRDTVAKK